MASANDLGELANLLGLPAVTFIETIEIYNAAIAAGAESTLHPPRRVDKFRPMPINEPPFYGVNVCAGITHAMGGLAIDECARVLRSDGSAIAGLYAAGTATGGLEGGPKVGYLGGLAKSAITGLLAAENIASSLPGR